MFVDNLWSLFVPIWSGRQNPYAESSFHHVCSRCRPYLGAESPSVCWFCMYVLVASCSTKEVSMLAMVWQHSHGYNRCVFRVTVIAAGSLILLCLILYLPRIRFLQKFLPILQLATSAYSQSELKPAFHPSPLNLRSFLPPKPANIHSL